MHKTTFFLTAGVLALTLNAGAALAQDATAGEAVFKKCHVCHSTEAGKMKVGPSLHGVVGRTPGTLAGYKYSDAMKAFGASGAKWDEATLDAYLENPRGKVPKVKMIFPGLKNEKDRKDVIAFLATKS